MKYNPTLHHRHSIRLKYHNYSKRSVYFITLCCQHHACLFGHITHEKLVLNKAGTMVFSQWQQLPSRFSTIILHDFIVMPNHFHGIIEFTENVDKALSPSKQEQRFAPTLGGVIGAFKSLSTHEYIQGVNKDAWQPFDKKLWQRNYYEHIIRDQKAYNQIVEYIQTNAARWQDDTYYFQT